VSVLSFTLSFLSVLFDLFLSFCSAYDSLVKLRYSIFANREEREMISRKRKKARKRLEEGE
jgi:hypothetical protein